jgi:23S rRNA pseudouridine2605 synthase
VVEPGANAWIEITIAEGRKHQVRNMMLAVGHPVVKLKRVRYGGLELGNLEPGRLRPLKPAEVDRLRRSIQRGKSGRRQSPTRANRS